MLAISEINLEFKSQQVGSRTFENVGVNLTPEALRLRVIYPSGCLRVKNFQKLNFKDRMKNSVMSKQELF